MGLKWQKIAGIGGVSIPAIVLLIMILNLSGVTHSIPDNQICGDECFSVIEINTSYWRLCFEHGEDRPVMYAKVSRSRTRWINLDRISSFIPTQPEIDVYLLFPTNRISWTVYRDENGKRWRYIKDGDCLERYKKPNKLGVLGIKDPEVTVKWGFDLQEILNKYITFDPVWLGSGEANRVFNFVRTNTDAHYMFSNVDVSYDNKLIIEFDLNTNYTGFSPSNSYVGLSAGVNLAGIARLYTWNNDWVDRTSSISYTAQKTIKGKTYDHIYYYAFSTLPDFWNKKVRLEITATKQQLKNWIESNNNLIVYFGEATSVIKITTGATDTFTTDRYYADFVENAGWATVVYRAGNTDDWAGSDGNLLTVSVTYGSGISDGVVTRDEVTDLKVILDGTGYGANDDTMQAIFLPDYWIFNYTSPITHATKVGVNNEMAWGDPEKRAAMNISGKVQVENTGWGPFFNLSQRWAAITNSGDDEVLCYVWDGDSANNGSLVWRTGTSNIQFYTYSDGTKLGQWVWTAFRFYLYNNASSTFFDECHAFWDRTNHSIIFTETKGTSYEIDRGLEYGITADASDEIDINITRGNANHTEVMLTLDFADNLTWVNITNSSLPITGSDTPFNDFLLTGSDYRDYNYTESATGEASNISTCFVSNITGNTRCYVYLPLDSSDVYLMAGKDISPTNTTPVVSLYNFTNFATDDTTPGIDFNFTDDDLKANCSLFLNGTLKAVNEATDNATRTTLTPPSLDVDDYAVIVSCSDGTFSANSSSVIMRVSISITLLFTLNGTSADQKYELGTMADIDVSGIGTVCIRFNGSIDDVCGTNSAEFLNAIYPHLGSDINGNTVINISSNRSGITFDLTNRSEMLNATFNITGYVGTTGEIYTVEDNTEDAHAFIGSCYIGAPCANGYDENWNTFARSELGNGGVKIYENYTVSNGLDSANYTIKHVSVSTYNIYYWNQSISAWSLWKTTTENLVSPYTTTETFALPDDAINGSVLQVYVHLTDSGTQYYYESKIIWYYIITLYPKDLEIDINDDGTIDYIIWGNITGTSAMVNEFTNGKTEENLTYETGGINIRYIKIPRNISNVSAFQNFTFNISGFSYIDTEEIGQNLTVNAANSPYTLYGNYTFDNLWIQSDGYIVLLPYNGTDDTGTLSLDIRTNFTIESGGYIDANATGFGGGDKCNSTDPARGGDGTGGGTDSGDVGSGAAGAGGGSYGGIGGRGGSATGGPNFGVGGPIYGSNSSKSIQMGSGGGGAGCGGSSGVGIDGNPGGGSVWIVSPVIEIYGNILAKGSQGVGAVSHPTNCDKFGGGGGAGSGGGILLVGTDVTISGTLDATGGIQGTSYGCAGAGLAGAGGRIKIFYNTLTNTGTLNVGGYQSGSVHLKQEATAYATNVTVDIGADGVTEWEMDSTIILNSTESPIKVEINMLSLLDYVDEDCNDFETYCLMLVQITSETPAIILVDTINLTYGFNPIVMNVSKFNLSGNTVDINFSGEQIGITELSGINFTYNGRYTYNVTGFNTTHQTEHMLDIFWSNHSVSLPYTWTNYVIFNIFNETDNITPWAQDGNTPIYNITYLGNHTANLSFEFNESTPICMDFYFSLDNMTWFNYTKKWWYSNQTNENQNIGIWMKLNATNCSQRLYFPRAYFKGYCYNCLGGQ